MGRTSRSSAPRYRDAPPQPPSDARPDIVELRPSSWIELLEQLHEGSWSEELGRHRSPFVYRGMSRAEHDLITSLLRVMGDDPSREGHLLRNFRKYAHRNAFAGDSIWNWLALAQHHGLPTRLLDWTYSPLVALHNATENTAHFATDGVVWCVDHGAANVELPPELKALLAEEGSDVFTAELLDRVAPTLRDLDALQPEPFVIFLEPPSLDERIINQFALFSLMSSPTARLDHWLANHPQLVRRILVPAELKWEVRDKLDQSNITERVLYPGLDGLSRWLTRYYSPRPCARSALPRTAENRPDRP